MSLSGRLLVTGFVAPLCLALAADASWRCVTGDGWGAFWEGLRSAGDAALIAFVWRRPRQDAELPGQGEA